MTYNLKRALYLPLYGISHNLASKINLLKVKYLSDYTTIEITSEFPLDLPNIISSNIINGKIVTLLKYYKDNLETIKYLISNKISAIEAQKKHYIVGNNSTLLPIQPDLLQELSMLLFNEKKFRLQYILHFLNDMDRNPEELKEMAEEFLNINPNFKIDYDYKNKKQNRSTITATR